MKKELSEENKIVINKIMFITSKLDIDYKTLSPALTEQAIKIGDILDLVRANKL